MKTNRFLSVFLLVTLIVSLFAVPHASALEDPNIQAAAALLVDANTGNIVYGKNEHEELYPASLTKIMTALLTLEAVDSGKLSLDQKIEAKPSAFVGISEDGSSSGIQPGEIMSVEDLLYCMMVVSANEACNILAEEISGSISAFVDAMNAKAQELGCENTHFANANGLHDDRHYTSAWDLYLITREAMTHPDFMRIADTGDIILKPTNLHPENRYLHSTNYLISVWRSLGYINKNAHGIKTGHTSQAGHCLVSSASKGSLHFISVILGTERLELPGNEIRTMSFFETNRLFKWGFDNFVYRDILEDTESIADVEVALSKADHVTVHPAENVEVLVPSDLNVEDLERNIQLKSDPVEAPIAEGDVLGTLTLSHEGKDYATVDLLALSDVEASQLLVFWHNVQLFFAKPVVWVVSIILLALLVALLIWKIFFSRRRYRYGHSVGRGRNRSYHGRRHPF